MAATILDGVKIAAEIKAEVSEEVRAAHRGGGSARACCSVGGTRSGVGSLRPQQGQNVRATRDLQRETHACRQRDHGRDAGIGGRPEPPRRDRRHPGATAVAEQVDAKRVLLAVSRRKMSTASIR